VAQHTFPSLSLHRAAHERMRKQIKAFLAEHGQGKSESRPSY